MTKLSIFEISFANAPAVFYAGTRVEGHVTVQLSAPMKMRGIRLKFDGKAYVHWTERHSTGSGKNKRTVTRTYSATEQYFDQEVLLHGIWPSQGSSTIELPAGRHSFPFVYQLPTGLPSSFEGDHGHVRYVVSCKIDKPWKFDHKTKRPFTVISILDLNLEPNCANRLQGTKDKNLCCLCCKSGPITATFHIDRQGYVPGEAIKINAEISNAANRSMSKSYVELKMMTTFHATSKSRKVHRSVAMLTRPEIPAHSDDVWSGEELVIPPLPPSHLVGCGIIDIKYILQFNVDPSGPALDLEIPFEVIIGTIPLVSVVQQYPPMPPVGFSGNSPWPTAPPPEPGSPQPYPDMPPPSYSECITGQVDIRGEDDEYTRGEMNFAPAYTYYNWGRTPGALPPPPPEK